MDVWKKLKTALAPIVGSENCDAYIRYLRDIEVSEACIELKNLLDQGNSHHNEILSLLSYTIEDEVQGKHEIQKENEVRKKSKAQRETKIQEISKFQKKPNVSSFNKNSKNMGNIDGSICKKNVASVSTKKTAMKKCNKNEDVSRFPCTCLAQRHSLINNCTGCGRIVCEKEGSGSCFTCGEIVCTDYESEILQKSTNQSIDLLKKLTRSVKLDSDLKTAVDRKNKLINQDKEFSKSRVIDDQNDYYTSKNKWLPEEARCVLQKKEKLADEVSEQLPTNKLHLDFNENTGSLEKMKNSDDSSSCGSPNGHQDIEDIVELVIRKKYTSSNTVEIKDSTCTDPFLISARERNNVVESGFMNNFFLDRQDSMFIMPDFKRVQYSDDVDASFYF